MIQPVRRGWRLNSSIPQFVSNNPEYDPVFYVRIPFHA